MNSSDRIASSEIRARFANAMSDMYRREVPMYGTLLDMVKTINQQELHKKPELKTGLENSANLQRLSDERHGAIRLGKAEELYTMRRLFTVMGMFPVSYYDLSEAGMPVHSTAFRPLDLQQLNANPFRIFTSLLRLDLIDNKELRKQARELLDQRNIFSDGLLELIDTSEAQQGLNADQAEDFIHEAMQTFRWHKQAMVDAKTYQRFLKTHRLLADIVCFKGPHINHLTPRTLNIDLAQIQMQQYGLEAKQIIEGPPLRRNPILLRQTSFRALDESIEFKYENDQSESGSHTARFGEIEQRGQALTPKGRKLYDKLLSEVRQLAPEAVIHTENYYQELEKIFSTFPDDYEQIRLQGLGYFSYQVDAEKTISPDCSLDQLIAQGALQVHPLTYEDFLPVSAAGIFQSNLDAGVSLDFQHSPNQQAFEAALGCAVINEFDCYANIQTDSLVNALTSLGLDQQKRAELMRQLPTGI